MTVGGQPGLAHSRSQTLFDIGQATMLKHFSSLILLQVNPSHQFRSREYTQRGMFSIANYAPFRPAERGARRTVQRAARAMSRLATRPALALLVNDSIIFSVSGALARTSHTTLSHFYTTPQAAI